MSKKVTKKVEEEITETTTEQEKKPKNNINIGYAGTVSISVVDGNNNTIITKKHHNEGSKRLFKYICECLAANTSVIATNQPTKVCLIDILNNTPVGDIKNSFNEGNAGYSSQFRAITNPIAIYGPIIPDKVECNAASQLTPHKATLHFRIPYTYITGTEFCGLVLLPASKEDTNNLTTDWYAYYLLTQIELDSEVWTPIPISGQQNYNLIIDWELSVANNTSSNIDSNINN